jgi:hypothetical protein
MVILQALAAKVLPGGIYTILYPRLSQGVRQDFLRYNWGEIKRLC